MPTSKNFFMKKAIIFDLDNTIYPTKQLVKNYLGH